MKLREEYIFTKSLLLFTSVNITILIIFQNSENFGSCFESEECRVHTCSSPVPNLRLETFLRPRLRISKTTSHYRSKLRSGTLPKLLHVISFLEMCRKIFMRHYIA
jgi:hypothetical protein